MNVRQAQALIRLRSGIHVPRSTLYRWIEAGLVRSTYWKPERGRRRHIDIDERSLIEKLRKMERGEDI